jgi:hypothetical protein
MRALTVSGLLLVWLGAPGAGSPGWGQDSADFVVVSRDVGILFEHQNGRSPDKHLPETMGSGAVIWDYDNDGWPDIFIVNGGSLVDAEIAAGASHALFRNNGDGTFADTTAAAGIDVTGFGMGACAADYDNDGWPDLYLTEVQADRLYRNTGDGRFADVTTRAGLGSELWSASCAFGDYDKDGDVDLYVTHYVDWSLENNKHCTNVEYRAYCHPDVYNPLPDVLYRNNGDGTFTDAGADAGLGALAGNGLGVAFADYDEDGWPDIYVANDSDPNFMLHNLGDGAFEEAALWAGVAVGGEGQPQAGMGTDMADVDGDGLVEVFVTNLDRETHSLYQNLGGGFFADVTVESGLARETLPFVGFGTAFFDFDNDTDLDLAIANGDVLDNVGLFRDDATYEQRNLLLANDGTGRFTDVGPVSGSGFALEKVSRALAVGDLDNDGDLDILVTNNGQTADVLRNEGGSRNNSLLVRVVGTESNRSGVGARLRLTLGDRILARDVKAGSSYLGQNDLRVHFGLGNSASADRLEVTWPSGTVDVVEHLDANQIVTLVEGQGLVERRPYSTAAQAAGPR